MSLYRGVALLAALQLVAANLGIDVSQPVSGAAAACFRKDGASFGIVRAWESFGHFDSSAPGSVAALWDAGFSHVDVYMFPCALRDASAQAAQLRGNLTRYGVKYGQVWLDIETNPSPGCGWSASDKAANCAYIAELLAAAKAEGFSVGVYASNYEWSTVAGPGCTAGKDFPLWYAHYDQSPSFSDWQPFGGWAKPNIKQYNDAFGSCGVGADANYYPA